MQQHMPIRGGNHTQLSYRGRLAPSPTGLLHMGHAKTFWWAYQRCRDAGGTLILRNEDLDLGRAKQEYVQAFLEDLRWFGIEWTEGPDVGGPCGPYTQSERLGLYLAAFEKLREGGFLFPCSCSRKDIRSAVSAPHQGTEEPVYPGTCRPKLDTPICGEAAAAGNGDAPAAPSTGDVGSQEPASSSGDGRSLGGQWPSSGDGSSRVSAPSVGEGADQGWLRQRRDDSPGARNGAAAAAGGEPGPAAGAGVGKAATAAAAAQQRGVAWRFRVPDGEAISFVDGHCGPQTALAGKDFGDFVVWRDGVPSYQLACVVDDAAMGVTEVVRGEDLMTSTSRQLLLYRALGLDEPSFFHTPLVLDTNGVRLAKRHDALSLRAMREAGATPESLREGWEASRPLERCCRRKQE